MIWKSVRIGLILVKRSVEVEEFSKDPTGSVFHGPKRAGNAVAVDGEIESGMCYF